MTINPQQLDWPLIRRLAQASADAYRGATVSDPLTDAQAMVFVNPDGNIVVAFRGSSSPRDFMVDAQFWFKELLWSNDDNVAEVHHGFLDAFEAINAEVIRQVRAYLVTFPNAVIYICGHSLGGALAILCSLEFNRQKLPVAAVVTFGQPRVGNKAFAEIYNAAPGLGQTDDGAHGVTRPTLKDITYCVVNEGDPVPLLPPLLNGYRDCGTEIFVQKSGGVLVDPFIGFELFVDLLGAWRSWRVGQLGLLPNHFLAACQSRIQFL